MKRYRQVASRFTILGAMAASLTLSGCEWSSSGLAEEFDDGFRVDAGDETASDSSIGDLTVDSALDSGADSSVDDGADSAFDSSLPDTLTDVIGDSFPDTSDVGPDVDSGDGASTDTLDVATDSFVADVALDSADTTSLDVTPVDVGDSGSTDIGTDTGTDTGTADTGVPDTGSLSDSATDSTADTTSDTGPTDTGPTDTGPTDTGTLDTRDGGTSSPGTIACYNSSKKAPETCSGSNVCCGVDFFGVTYSCQSRCITIDFTCDDQADCGSGKVCCVKKTPVIGTVSGSDCRASCGGDIQLCRTDLECPSPKLCEPYSPPGGSFTLGQCK